MNTNELNYSNLNKLYKSIWYNRNLIKELTAREVLIRYKSSFLGLTWTFITLMLLIVYTFIFSFVYLKQNGVLKLTKQKLILQLYYLLAS